MNRRNFLKQGSLGASGLFISYSLPSFASFPNLEDYFAKNDLYKLFENPDIHYRPFVRWWWNGNKIEKSELLRELKVLKAAGIGGVEINPISFPSRTSDMNIKSVEWLSDEWIDILKTTLIEAKEMEMTCDLLVGSGFPFGAEFLEGEERSQIVVLGVKKVEGPSTEDISTFEFFKEADPAINNRYSGRTMELLSVKLVPDPINSMDDVVDLSDQISQGRIKIQVPEGKFAIYSLVKVTGFMKVIQGTPGGDGPVLNHFDEKAVIKYLNKMSDTIQNKMGPLSPYVRSFFVDSMETEGANWCSDMMFEFKKRRGYDLFAYLPFVLFKIGSMGNTYNYKYPADMSAEMQDMTSRMRYDFELTKAELFHERFVHTFSEWCTVNKIKSRAQAYGRGYFPLEGSFEIDIPECETWLKYGIGDDIPESEFTKYPWHLGQGNTEINKYVSSAAHLKGKKLISSEELTNTEMVFNESLETLKIAGDQSTLSGVTHPIFHGFNYSPPDAAFPGWITYGGYLNEKNTMWPYFNNYTDYRARLSALLQQATMFADIAVLAPTADLWSQYGAQNDPFPTKVHPSYQMLVWEAIHQNGNSCDYVSNSVISSAKMHDGFMHYNDRKYHTIFLIEVQSLEVSTVQKLYDFVSKGGRVFCVEAYPDKAVGWFEHDKRDEEVRNTVNKMKEFESRFIFLKKPESDFINWYKNIQEKYEIIPYVKIKAPQHFVKQIRYQTKNTEILFFSNSSNLHSFDYEIAISHEILRNRQAWLWDPINGKRYKIKISNSTIMLKLGPADSRLLIFDKDNEGHMLEAIPLGSPVEHSISENWHVELQHTDGTVKTTEFNTLLDLKDLPDYVSFSGTIIYKKRVDVRDKMKLHYLNMGKVYGICELIINGKNIGTQWYGNRIFPINNMLVNGSNTIEIRVVTVMVNYMKTLSDNEVAQYWTNEKRKNQPLQSMGLCGPITIY
jgi:hypothetical protein